MKLEDIQEAAKVIPVFMRTEEDQGPTLRLDYGCYRCEHRRPLGSRTPYATVVAYGENPDGEWREPRFGFTVAISDSSFSELSRNHHWARGMVNGATGFYDGWIGVAEIEQDPTIFVRLLNQFDGNGVEHKHARVNFAEIMDNYHDRELFYVTFEAYNNRSGLYVDPVDEIFEGREWTTEELNRFVHSPYNSVGDQKRILEYYWGNITTPKKLTQIKAGDIIPEDIGAARNVGALNEEALQALMRARQRAAANRVYQRRNINAAANVNYAVVNEEDANTANPFEVRYNLRDE